MPSVLITGAAGAIGRALAAAFSSPGALVALADVDEAGLARTAEVVRQRRADALSLVMDVTSSESVDAAFEGYRTTGRPLDVLINSAAVGGGEPVVGSDEGRWRRAIDVNLVGMYLVSRAGVPIMPDSGRVINMASVLGRFGVPGYSAYCAAKHGVIGFTRALALELAARRITVNAICPGWVDSPMARLAFEQDAAARGVSEDEAQRAAMAFVPLGRMLDPSEVAGMAVFLASPAAAHITGQAFNICGGQVMT